METVTTGVPEPTPAYAAVLEGDAARTATRATPAGAFDLAMQTYLRGERLDMRELATQLDVGRTTIYRWTGDRERLLADLIWYQSQRALDAIWAATTELRGSTRLLTTARAYLEQISADAPFLAFVRNETRTALRLLTTRGPYQNRLVSKVGELLDEEADRTGLPLRADTGLLAYSAVRIIEGFAYNDAIAQIDLRIDDALDILALVLS
ncbi:QsdR family transcriptional regulator [Nocardia nova]|uniref:QsdR family transcriptional regulator n=1 Tax=Nocardia nova TaxID=37330 RepID=UPI0033DF85D1